MDVFWLLMISFTDLNGISSQKMKVLKLMADYAQINLDRIYDIGNRNYKESANGKSIFK